MMSYSANKYKLRLSINQAKLDTVEPCLIKIMS